MILVCYLSNYSEDTSLRRTFFPHSYSEFLFPPWADPNFEQIREEAAGAGLITHEEIARHCGVSKAMVHQVISTYNRFGVEAVETAGRGGRRHEYLSVEEEKRFLAPFFARAESGEIATATEVKLAFEAQVGHEVEESTIYRLLDRHGWRTPHAAPETSQRE